MERNLAYMSTLVGEIGAPGANHERLAKKIIAAPELVTEVIAGLSSDAARIKFGCAKMLGILAERCPELLYSHFETFRDLLDHKNKILQWQGALILSHLVRVDKKEKFAPIFDKYFAPMIGPAMITAANVIQGGARIAQTRPEWAARIASEILKVSAANYATPECRNVAIGHAIQALAQFCHLLDDQAPVLRFVKAQLENPRPAVRKKAAAFMKMANGR